MIDVAGTEVIANDDLDGDGDGLIVNVGCKEEGTHEVAIKINSTR